MTGPMLNEDDSSRSSGKPADEIALPVDDDVELGELLQDALENMASAWSWPATDAVAFRVPSRVNTTYPT